MGQVSTVAPLFVLLVLVRGLGQSALSVVSLATVGQWFQKTIERAMATYSVTMTVGFMIAFPLLEAMIRSQGWRAAWSGLGGALILALAPLALLLPKPARNETDETESPEASGGVG